MDITKDSRPVSVEDLPLSGFKEFVISLANRFQISYKKTSMDQLAETITRLSDDDVVMDDTEKLIIELGRSGVLEKEAVIPLHAKYLREKKSRVRSLR